MQNRHWAAVCALALTLAACLIGAAGASAADLPVIYNASTGSVGFVNPDASPAGSNDWSCHPTAAHPRPVVLVHGLGADMAENWGTLSPLLKNNGYCVFALNYGETDFSLDRFFGFAPMENQAVELAGFIDRVLSATGASQVDIVGHSQGGVMPRYYMKFLGGAAKVHAMVALAPNNHGTTLQGITALANYFPQVADATVFAVCESCAEHVAGSAFMTNLNSGGETLPGVNYTVISSKYDQFVTPYTGTFLSGPGVTNITVQNQCSLDWSEHIALAYDRVALRDVLNALDPAHAAAVPCVPVLPYTGG